MPTDEHDDAPLVCGVGKQIGIKAEHMGFVVVDNPDTPTRRQTATIRHWGAVAAGLLQAAVGHKSRQASLTPQAESGGERI